MSEELFFIVSPIFYE